VKKKQQDKKKDKREEKEWRERETIKIKEIKDEKE